MARKGTTGQAGVTRARAAASAVAPPPGDVILLPGFGGTATQPLLVALTGRLTERGYSCRREAPPKVRPTKELSVETQWLDALVEGLTAPPVLVGRSFGGRIAARVAVRRPARALVLLGFPIRPPGRPRPLDEVALAAVGCPTLVVQGQRDELGPLTVLQRIARKNPLVTVHVLDGVGHAFGRRTAEALDAVVAWLGGPQGARCL